MSIASFAIFLYVVHFPPEIVIKPESVTDILWPRDISFVPFFSSFGAARGRNPEKTDNIHSLCETYRPLFPTKRITPITIRQSVIANLLKQGKDLRIVQVFAGHKYVSATERYRQNNLATLQKAVQKFHPLRNDE